MAITTAHSIGVDYVVPTVAIKDDLTVADPWVDVEDLYCDRRVFKCNTWDQAELHYDFGADVKRISAAAATAVAKLDLIGKYVRVTTGGYHWYGIIAGVDVDRQADASGTLVGRRQFFKAKGLAWLLARKQIRTAVIHDQVRINRALVFNGGDNARILGQDRKGRANMHPADDSGGWRSFYDQQGALSAPDLWSAADIAKHVLYYHGPASASLSQYPCPVELDTAAEPFLDDWFPTVRTENRTVLDVLNALANPRRGLCWWVEYLDSGVPSANGELQVHVNSQAPSNISLAQGGTLPQNSDQETINTDGDAEARVSVSVPDSRAYTRVVCRGARQTGTGTWGVPDATLSGYWDSLAAEPGYKAAASGTGGYDGLAADEQKARNDAFRRQEGFDGVFELFAVPANWDGELYDGAGGDTAAPVFPDLGTSDPSDRHPHHWGGLRFLPHLMITTEGTAPDRDKPEYQRPLALVEVDASAGKSQFAEKLSDADFATESGATFVASYHLGIDDDVFGIRLRSSKAPHTLALNDWAGASPTATDPEVDWTTVRCTLTAEADAYCEGIYPDTLSSTAVIQELTIDMGEDYRLDYVAPGTVYDLDNGVDVNHAGGIIRDDRDALADFARFAYEWYSADRKSINITLNRVDVSSFALGKMLTTLGSGSGSETVNTVIGAIEHNFGSRGGSTRIATLPDNLDLPGLLS